MRTTMVPTLMAQALALLLAACQPPNVHARSSVMHREARSSSQDVPSYSPHVSVGVLTDLRKFFDELQEELNAMDLQEQNPEEVEAMYEAVRAMAAETDAAPPTLPDPRKANQMRFVPRVTQRKIKLNPSLLRSGLGRK